jgi:hypothetical protein
VYEDIGHFSDMFLYRQQNAGRICNIKIVYEINKAGSEYRQTQLMDLYITYFVVATYFDLNSVTLRTLI